MVRWIGTPLSFNSLYTYLLFPYHTLTLGLSSNIVFLQCWIHLLKVRRDSDDEFGRFLEFQPDRSMIDNITLVIVGLHRSSWFFMSWLCLLKNLGCLDPNPLNHTMSFLAHYIAFRSSLVGKIYIISFLTCTIAFPFEHAIVLILAWAPRFGRVYIDIFGFPAHSIVIPWILLFQSFRLQS